MNSNALFHSTLWAVALILVALLAFGAVATRAENPPPNQTQTASYPIGNPDRFGDTLPAEILGMTYAQPIECSPALKHGVPAPLFCGVHPMDGNTLRLELMLFSTNSPDSRYYLSAHEKLYIDGNEYRIRTQDSGFFYVRPLAP